MYRKSVNSLNLHILKNIMTINILQHDRTLLLNEYRFEMGQFLTGLA